MAIIANTINFTAPISPPTTDTSWGSHYSKYGIGGLQQYDSLSELDSIPITRLLTGSIGYALTENKYYMWSNSAWTELSALTSGTPNFPGLTSSAGITITTGSLSIYEGAYSATIDVSSNGTIVLDGSGNSGVQITDGWLFLGASSSTAPYWASGSYTNEAGNLDGTTPAISTSAKVVAKYGFATTNADSTAQFQVNSTGDLQCNSLKETSLRLYKHDIYNIGSPQLDNIAKLKPITFIYNTDVAEDVNDVRVRQAGFIAEQMQQVYPQIVWYKDGKLAGIQYQRLTAYLTKGIQELIQKNKQLQTKLQSRDKEFDKIIKQLKNIKQVLNIK